MSTNTTIADVALEYARRGQRMFPCWWTPEPGVCACPLGAAEKDARGKRHSKGKHPIPHNGFHSGTNNTDKVRAWWSTWPDANIGLVTGHPGPDVVDIDVTNGKPGLESAQRLANAGLLRGAVAEIRTASGGSHIYFRGTTQGNGALDEYGVDFRATGGYVIAPPSKIDGHYYSYVTWRPLNEGGTVDWARITAFLKPPKPKRPASEFSRLGPTAGPGLAAWARRKLEELLQEPVVQGQRSDRFYAIVGQCRTAGMSLQEAVLVLEPWCDMVGKYVGHVDREVARCWEKVQVPA